jgi:hypothetical protein
VLAQPRLLFAGQDGARCDVHSTPTRKPSIAEGIMFASLRRTPLGQRKFVSGS